MSPKQQFEQKSTYKTRFLQCLVQEKGKRISRHEKAVCGDQEHTSEVVCFAALWDNFLTLKKKKTFIPMYTHF